MKQHKSLIFNLFSDITSLKDCSVLERYYEKDVIDHDITPDQPPGIQGIARAVEQYLYALDNLEIEVVDIIQEGNTIATRERWTGIFTKPLFGKPPTQKPFESYRMHFFVIKNNLISEEWVKGSVI